MKKYIILIVWLFLFGCVAAKQPRNFNVMPTFCYDGECFSVEKKSNIMLVNTNMPEGDYKIEYVETKVELGEKKTSTIQIYMRVHNDIITFEIEDILMQYNQKTQKVIHVLDKSGNSNPILIKFMKEFFQNMFGIDRPSHASSGQIFPQNFKNNFYGSALVKTYLYSYIHGETYYNNNKYTLVEIKGEQKISIKGSSMDVIYSGYTLSDPTMNLVVKCVIDMTFMENGKSESLRNIITQKIVE